MAMAHADVETQARQFAAGTGYPKGARNLMRKMLALLDSTREWAEQMRHAHTVLRERAESAETLIPIALKILEAEERGAAWQREADLAALGPAPRGGWDLPSCAVVVERHRGSDRRGSSDGR